MKFKIISASMVTVLFFVGILISSERVERINIKKGSIVELLLPNGEKIGELSYDDFLNRDKSFLHDYLLNHKKRSGNGVYVIKYRDPKGKVHIKLLRFIKDRMDTLPEVGDEDTIAPEIKIISGPNVSLTTNQSFAITFSVDENYGYYSVQSGIYERFEKGTKAVDISNSLTLKYYAEDEIGNNSETNSLAFTISVPVTPTLAYFSRLGFGFSYSGEVSGLTNVLSGGGFFSNDIQQGSGLTNTPNHPKFKD